MKAVVIILCPILALTACSTVEEPRATADQIHSSYPLEDLTSLQFAEPIDSDTFRIHNIFRKDSGEIVNLGTYLISSGEIAVARGHEEMPVQAIETEIVRIEDHRIFLRSGYSLKNGKRMESDSSLPIRKPNTEQDSDGNAEKPPGVEPES